MANKIITCKTCGAEIAKNAKTCPSCGAKNKKGKKKWIILGIILLVIIFIVIGSSGGDSKDIDYSKPDYTVSADTVISAYRNNSVSADETYKGKVIQVNGKVSNISDSFIYLKGDEEDNWLNTVDCTLISGQDDIVRSLSKDMIISIIGLCDSVGAAGDVKLKNCKIVADNIEIKPTAAPVEENAVIKVDANKLLEEYNNNSVAADDAYKGKTLQVTGKIYSIEDGYIKIESSDSWEFSNVHAYYASSENVTSLSKGDQVTVIGTCKGEEIFGDVKLSDCKIVR